MAVTPPPSPRPTFTVAVLSAEELETQIVYRGVSYTVKFTPPEGYGNGPSGTAFKYTADHIKAIQTLAKSILEAEVKNHPDQIKIDTELKVDFVDHTTDGSADFHTTLSIKKTSEPTFTPRTVQDSKIQTLFKNQIPLIYTLERGIDLTPSPSPTSTPPIPTSRSGSPHPAPRGRKVHGGRITSPGPPDIRADSPAPPAAPPAPPAPPHAAPPDVPRPTPRRPPVPRMPGTGASESKDD